MHSTIKRSGLDGCTLLEAKLDCYENPVFLFRIFNRRLLVQFNI